MDFLIEIIYFPYLDLFYIFPSQGGSLQRVERGAAPWVPSRKSFSSDARFTISEALVLF